MNYRTGAGSTAVTAAPPAGAKPTDNNLERMPKQNCERQAAGTSCSRRGGQMEIAAGWRHQRRAEENDPAGGRIATACMRRHTGNCPDARHGMASEFARKALALTTTPIRAGRRWPRDSRAPARGSGCPGGQGPIRSPPHWPSNFHPKQQARSVSARPSCNHDARFRSSPAGAAPSPSPASPRRSAGPAPGCQWCSASVGRGKARRRPRARVGHDADSGPCHRQPPAPG